MNNGEDVWICLSDLFAGLMAFFVFVCVGIFTSYTELEAEVFSQDIHSTDVRREDNATLIHGLTFGVDYIYFNSQSFENDQWELSDQNKEALPLAVTTVEQWLADDSMKAIFIGHASCASSIEAADIQGSNSTKSANATELERELGIARFSYNYQLSVKRAHTLYMTFKDTSAKIQAADKEGRIRYIGMSERLAASGQNDIICQDRKYHSNQDPFRSAEIRIVKEWPVLFKVNAVGEALPGN